MAENQITIVGNVTDEPELRFTPSGQAVANFTVAVNRRYKNRDGNWEDKLDGFFRCSAWGSLGENVAESCKKGTRVLVSGRLQQRSWEDQQGNTRRDIEIQVDEAGPSLRWATAAVQKSQRSGPSQGAAQSAPQSAAPAPQAAPAADWGPAPVGAPEQEGGF